MASKRKQELSPSSYPSAKFFALLQKAWGVVVLYKEQVIVGGVVIVVVAASWISWVAWTQYRYSAGLQQLSAGMAALDKENLQQAIDLLKEAEQALSGSAAQGVALLYLGEAYEKDDQPAQAKAMYERSAQVRNNRGYITQVALLRLGQVAEQAGNLDTATEWYRRASLIDRPGKVEALLALGEVAERNQDAETSATSYEDLLEQYPESPLAELIKAKKLR
jgi:tetratricopeptide (TPR) repeat protein